MKESYLIAVILYVLGMSFSCGGGGPADETAEQDAVERVPELVPVLSIGIEMGDSGYVFGDIRDACVLHDGRMVVFDSYDNTISAYSPEGTFLEEFGGRGEGPGEFGRSFGMTVLSDGRLLVTDPMLARVTLFEPDLTVSDMIGGFVPWPPERISAAAGSTYVGAHRTFDRENSLYGHLVALWSDSPEADVEYYRRQGDFNMQNLRESTEANQVVFTADYQGRVYIAPYSTDEYRIDVLGPDGENLYSIREDREPENRPAEEIQREIEEMREQLEREGAPEMEWHPAEQYHLVPLRGMGIDDQGRLWVRDGRSVHPRFSVYSGEVHQFDIELTDADLPLEDLTVKVTPQGILAWQGDPETYPRLFVLELI